VTRKRIRGIWSGYPSNLRHPANAVNDLRAFEANLRVGSLQRISWSTVRRSRPIPALRYARSGELDRVRHENP